MAENTNNWTLEEDEILKKYYPTEGATEVHKLPNKVIRDSNSTEEN